jgi:hypothetical protein
MDGRLGLSALSREGLDVLFCQVPLNACWDRAPRRLLDALAGHLGAIFVGHDSNPQAWLLTEDSQFLAMDIAIPHDYHLPLPP